MCFFAKINISFGCNREIREKLINNVFLPCILILLLSNLVNSSVDYSSRKVENSLKKTTASMFLFLSYRAGKTVHLAFCFHMFCHFLIATIRMYTYNEDQNNARVLPIVGNQNEADGQHDAYRERTPLLA